jgi:hypothetical protein
MKSKYIKIPIHFFLPIFFITIFNCKKNLDQYPDTDYKFKITANNDSIYRDSARISLFIVNPNKTISASLKIQKIELLNLDSANSIFLPLNYLSKLCLFDTSRLTITKLVKNTRYRLIVNFITQKGNSEISSDYKFDFKTNSSTRPQINHNQTIISKLFFDSVTIKFNIADNGGSIIEKVGITLSQNNDITIKSIGNNPTFINSYKFSDSVLHIKLPKNQTYWGRLFVINKNDTGLSTPFKITPNSVNLPVINKYFTDSIRATTARVVVEILNWGGDYYKDNYLILSSNPFFPANQCINVTGSFDSKTNSIIWNFANLRALTKYYFKFSISNRFIWLNDITDNFTTLVPENPSFSKPISINNYINTSTISYKILNDGGSTFSENGVVFSTTNENPTLPADQTELSNSKLINYQINTTLKNLIPNQTYYCKAYIKRNSIYFYSDSIKIKTFDIPEIAYKSCIVGGFDSVNLNINFNYQKSIIPRECGVVLSSVRIPDTSDIRISIKNLPTSQKDTTIILKNLTRGQLYYSRLYLINSQGVYYSNSKNFKTFKGVPEMHISDTISKGVKRVLIKAYIDSKDGLPLSNWGICYNSTGNPTLNDNVIYSNDKNSSNAIFEIKNLNHLQAYKVRTFAINANGVFYESISTNISDLIPFKGQGGGVVFFDRGYYKDGWRFLESSLKDTISYSWGCSSKASGTFFNATDSLLGNGYENTEKITLNCSDSKYAAIIAKKFKGTSNKNDWYLPNVKEIQWACGLNNLGITNFYDWLSWYSSSQESSHNLFWWADANNCGPNAYKVDKYTIRTIRRY